MGKARVVGGPGQLGGGLGAEVGRVVQELRPKRFCKCPLVTEGRPAGVHAGIFSLPVLPLLPPFPCPLLCDTHCGDSGTQRMPFLRCFGLLGVAGRKQDPVPRSLIWGPGTPRLMSRGCSPHMVCS